MESCPGTKLNKHTAFSYKSFGSPSEFTDESPSIDSKQDLKSKHDPIQLKEMPSGSPEMFDQSFSKLQEVEEECCSPETPVEVYAAAIVIAVGVTIALVLQIHLNAGLVCCMTRTSELMAFLDLIIAALQVTMKGVLSDHEHCTTLSEGVLRDGGSSVDAAIAGALCLGIVHQHVSSVGGGGVMLVHDIRRNETRVINFQGSAPELIREEMVQNSSEMKAGLLVGVPGMLMGLHRAHRLYGSWLWEDVVSRAASVARDGFNVSRSLADAISEIEGEELPKHFRDRFLPEGRALSAGSFVTMPELAEVLEAGVWNFYSGAFAQEIENEVQAHGGVLSRGDLGNYTVEIQQALEGGFGDFIIQVPPPPSAGAVLIAALNLLEGFHFKENGVKEKEMYHWIEEALTTAFSMAAGLGDHKNNLTDLLSSMLNKSQAEILRNRMIHFQMSQSLCNSTIYSFPAELLAAQVVVMGPDNLMVSVASTLNRPFGSRILTPSGILLNSLILDFFWPNKTSIKPQIEQFQENHVEARKRPLTLLMPAMLVPSWDKCGTYMALSSSGGRNHLNRITQMLVNVLFLHKEKNDSVPLRRLHTQREPYEHHDSAFTTDV
ncbi:Gamma-glutamyltransferase 7 [Oryzias melastigma]|uniref:Glutathione hydrolase n=1 Tax=Oryzias melastigma TaxID=30732 RepID=A0A834F6B7_ORYME|nr:Gamma-glutamyltransferase 7 [Oryzias melastigma]